MNTLAYDMVELENDIKAVRERARRVHQRVMREFPDGPAKPQLGLMELAVRSLGQANDAARYARHALSEAAPLPATDSEAK